MGRPARIVVAAVVLLVAGGVLGGTLGAVLLVAGVLALAAVAAEGLGIAELPSSDTSMMGRHERPAERARPAGDEDDAQVSRGPAPCAAGRAAAPARPR